MVPRRPRSERGEPMDDHARHNARAKQLVLIGTYPPTECGIATYTANLRSGLDQAGFDCRVVRMLARNDALDTRPPLDPEAIVDVWPLDDPDGPERCARTASRFDAVLLQHEFGIFPGPDGVDVVRFVEACRAPLFTVLHTALRAPTPSQREIVERIARRSVLIIVHSAVARSRLLAAHDLDASRVVVVPHGATPNLSGPPALTSPDPIVLTWGLLGPGKGIERGIHAVAQLRDEGLDVRYVIAGETHPNVRKQQGEAYREGLGRARGGARRRRPRRVPRHLRLLGRAASGREERGRRTPSVRHARPGDLRSARRSARRRQAGDRHHVPACRGAEPDGSGPSRRTRRRGGDRRHPVAHLRRRPAARPDAGRSESRDARYDWPIIGDTVRRLIETSLREIELPRPLAG